MIRVRREVAITLSDKKRKRLELCIGKRLFKITRKEALSLRNQLHRFKLGKS